MTPQQQYRFFHFMSWQAPLGALVLVYLKKIVETAVTHWPHGIRAPSLYGCECSELWSFLTFATAVMGPPSLIALWIAAICSISNRIRPRG